MILLLLVAFLPAQGQTVHNLTSLVAEGVRGMGLDDAGSVVYGVSSSNQFGANPRCSWQIFRWDPATGAGSQVTSFEKGVETLSVSDDGAWLAFISHSDLLGSNHDASAELYVMTSDGAGIVQLTSDPAADAGDILSATIAGSGNRVVFLANTDPLGSNPGRHQQVFAIDRDGSDLAQLTHASSDPLYPEPPSISDDGGRIVFASFDDLTGENPGRWGQVYAVLSDGTGLRQVTHGTNMNVTDAVLSGNGTSIAFERSYRFVDKIEWDGTGLQELTAGSHPSITDDGHTIFYSLLQEFQFTSQIWRIAADGTGNTQITSGAVQYNFSPMVSGNGNRVAFFATGGPYPGGDNPDHGTEQMVMDSSGDNLRQLTRLVLSRDVRTSTITPDGARVFFSSTTDGAYGNWDVYRIQADGSQLTQLTHLSDMTVYQVAPAPDGSVVAFSAHPSFGNGRGTNGIYKVQADGTGLLRLTPGSGGGYSAGPVITADGLWVIFEASGLNAGTATCCSSEIYRVRLDGSFLFNVTAENGENADAKKPRVSENTPLPWIVYQSAANFDGQNPDGSLEILRIKLNGISLQRLTADPVYESIDPDISANGNLVVYTSAADPLGTNPEHNDEIFLYDVAAATRRQLTFTPSGESYKPQITRDGSAVFFHSSAPFFEPNRDGHFEPYRVSIANGVVERLGGTRCCGAAVDYFAYPGDAREWLVVSADRTGNRAVVSGFGDWNDQNPDGGGDAFLVDYQVKPKLRVGKAVPTLLTWDNEPKPRRYDLLRGNLASLAAGGSSVDLGPVACLEDDSPDAGSGGSEDPAQPSAGHAFFYLVRGSQGLDDGPGSWGTGSGNRERVAGPGACSP